MLNRIALTLLLGLSSMAAMAQVPVVDAGRGQSQPAAQQDNQLMMTLYTQLDALKQEVQNLRGMVEEQANQLRRLQTESRDRYIDVDRRLSELSGGAVGIAPALPGATNPDTVPPGQTPPVQTGGVQLPPPAATSPQGRNNPPQFGNPSPQVSGVAPAQTPAPTAAQAAEAQLGEQDLYRTALNKLLEEFQYEESIRLFQSYIERFPQGRLVGNAIYWQGEALILVERYDQARDIFTRLITEYPQDPKAAGAMLKLGDVYQRMGNQAQAEQTWREIATRYPENASEINIAQSRLRGQ